MYNAYATNQVLGAMEPQAEDDEVAARGVDYQAAHKAHAGRDTSGRLVTIVVTMW
jgi:hypothetical protein